MINIKLDASNSDYQTVVDAFARRVSGVTGSGKKDSDGPVRRLTGIDAISAVKMSEKLTAAVDAWAEAHQTVRSDAIRQLVEIGLSVSNATPSEAPAASRDPAAIEQRAVQQIDEMLDPSLPAEERERRIRRLTEGPPEFAPSRIDLPKHEP